jgi:hypothetical protein
MVLQIQKDEGLRQRELSLIYSMVLEKPINYGRWRKN